jgi:hypothetical protein
MLSVIRELVADRPLGGFRIIFAHPSGFDIGPSDDVTIVDDHVLKMVGLTGDVTYLNLDLVTAVEVRCPSCARTGSPQEMVARWSDKRRTGFEDTW